ncbi:hypothetical protein ATCV1_z754R [Acanthocystis turfacea chlorella virus 1]|uniref:Uncharacterized protein z754R n=1 Tax=Chlorovirus heliozoae TaxID=322019 RepID=A7KA14_9PHYC|nr:hypothetical protein ATCV1_z754R [Acanthocystis turfacea chlorella virus 1]ABT16888.1 hypothetical protein ATCV1_z754R [Acanthocystis turfacea chlorella virus 1]
MTACSIHVCLYFYLNSCLQGSITSVPLAHSRRVSNIGEQELVVVDFKAVNNHLLVKLFVYVFEHGRSYDARPIVLDERRDGSETYTLHGGEAMVFYDDEAMVRDALQDIEQANAVGALLANYHKSRALGHL